MPEYAYVTGGASGLGAATARMLAKRGIKVFIADRDEENGQKIAKEIGGEFGKVDLANWISQVKAFTQAVSAFGRIDYVYGIGGIGERRWLPNNSASTSGHEFEMPDLSVLDIDLTGVLYTSALAIQQARRQDVGQNGFRCKIGLIASVCGFYCCPTLPIYTAAKHGVVGFVRSYGKYLPSEKITLNAITPNVIRTNISTPAFYDKLEAEGLLTPIEGVVDAFESLLGDNPESGECFEIGPNYAKGQGIVKPKFVEFVDDESKRTFDVLEPRGRPLQLPG